MTPIRRRSANRLYATFALIALLAGVLTVLALRVLVDPYRLESRSAGPISGVDDEAYMFPVDLYGDRSSEIVILRNRPSENSYELIVVPSLDSIGVIRSVNQIAEPLDWRRLSAADLDGDGRKELILLTNHKNPCSLQDTVFLYVKDLFVENEPNGLLIAERLPVVIREDFQFPRPWTFRYQAAAGVDLNGDGLGEVLFGMPTAKDITARGIYAVDIRQQTVIRRRHLGGKADKGFYFSDMDGDGQPEILFTTPATNNAPDSAAFADTTAWLVALNSELEVLEATRSFGGISRSLSLRPVAGSNGERWFLVENVVNPPGMTIRLLNRGMETIRERHYAGIAIPVQGGAWLDDEASQFVGLFRADSVEILDGELNQVAAYPIQSGSKSAFFGFPWRQKYLLFHIEPGRTTVRDMLSGERLARVNDSLRNARIFPVRRAEEARFELVANYQGKRNEHIRLVPNSAHGAWALAGLGGFLAMFLLLVGTHQLWEWIAIQRDYRRFLNRPEAGPLLVIDEKDTLIAISQRFCALLERREGDLTGRPWREVLAHAPELCRIIDASLRSIPDEPVPVTTLGRGRPIVAELRMSAFHSVWRVRYHFVFYLRDHTEAVEGERLRAWSGTVRRLTHDIKTPLASMILSLDTIQKELDSGNGDVGEDIALVRAELERMRVITRGFQQFADLEKPRPEVLDLRDWIERSMEHFTAYRREDMIIEVDIGADAELVWADGRQVMVILHILVENAVDAMGGVGNVTVRTRLARDLSPEDGERVVIAVSDSGPGIPMERAERVFDPHYTTKPHGSGMGLAFARKLAADNGGDITLENGDAGGARFQVFLPRVLR